ncbi:MAG TPA: efflux transporter outer membrane subunit [Noviherbaspirillum sp.]|uniref:efflux transporter outer membrane subunit n=1 Tax=Noviherbaspirillum sp. TaxID=1926288 RepID=UPI002B470B62|nr:efflux transporter outer membrane subunit [Noviherbaspirillum sp.]HJV86726.1 efflux transporter outer membrane subunit [Noviherbaspirillum sp.]
MKRSTMHFLFPLSHRRLLHIALLPVLPILVAGCALSPVYERPATPAPTAFKEAQGWVAAVPGDALDRGKWWSLFDDPVLNDLESAVEISNQNVAAATAAYAQARALVEQQRAALFPVVSLDAGASRSGGGTSSTRTTTASRSGNNVQLSLGATWEPDVWGRLRGAANSASASAQASAADLASAKLSAQGELAANYFSLRLADAQGALLRDTIAGYERALQIARNRYAAGIATKTDLLQAETQLANAQADEAGVVRQRAQFEHAIAVLVGKAPAEFTLAPAAWSVAVPQVPTGVPSTLLQRRPDIAAAERRVAAANEQIGVARAAFFPNIGLNASYGSSGSRVADLFGAGTSLWSLGLSAAQTLFNAGATSAKVAGAQAAQEEAAARYRQTVLAAFQDVENQLSAAQVLARQQDLRRQASQAADEAERLMLNRYRAGQVSFSEVVSAQASALSARRALVQAQADRQTAAIALIQALGGGWHAEP